MKILAIDTSCDETSAAVTDKLNVLSNVVWSQASLHAKFGGVYPSLAQRKHQERIDFVVERAVKNAGLKFSDLEAFAVTIGPGLAIALGVGIDKAKNLAKKYAKPLIPVNHLEAHFLSPLAQPATDKPQSVTDFFPALGLIVSGGNTQLILAEKLGKYTILATAVDDALGEALDKGARLLGLGYPGGPILEKFAKLGNSESYSLPIPLLGREKDKFSYSGLKTALVRLVASLKQAKGVLNKNDVGDLAAVYQKIAFSHILRVTQAVIEHLPVKVKYFFVGGGVAANSALRKLLRELAKNNKLTICFPYTKNLSTDNAAMIGVSAFLNYRQGKFLKPEQANRIDRQPKLKITDKLI